MHVQKNSHQVIKAKPPADSLYLHQLPADGFSGIALIFQGIEIIYFRIFPRKAHWCQMQS